MDYFIINSANSVNIEMGALWHDGHCLADKYRISHIGNFKFRIVV